jgi:trans-aconitate methyltransferase
VADVNPADLNPADLNPTVPHQARIYDYWIGGKDNFAADRVVGDAAAAVNPDIIDISRANRAFLNRAVRHLVIEAGIRQFLDVGTGIPAANNTHEVAQAAAPDARVVYVDRDPIVLAHARALLTSTADGSCTYLDADANEPDKVLALAAQTLDFGQPVAVMLLAILQVLDDPYAVVSTLLGALPPGSYLTLSHPAIDINAERMAAMEAHLNSSTPGLTATFRTRSEVERFFAGLDLVEPGVSSVTRWRPDPDDPGRELAFYAAMGKKP